MEGLGWDLYVLEGTMEAGGREGGREVCDLHTWEVMRSRG